MSSDKYLMDEMGFLNTPINDIYYIPDNISNTSYSLNFNNQTILNNKKISFLICQKQMIKFYKKFFWKLLNKKYFTIKDHKFSSYGMFFNNKFKIKTKYDIYLYR